MSAWAVLEDLFNSSPKLLRSEGKRHIESMVRCAVLCILSTRPQICEESETALEF